MQVGRFCADPKELSRAITLLLATSERLKFFPHTHSVSARKKYRDTDAKVGFTCEYHDCPLPPWRVPQRGCPFLLDETDFVGGRCFAKGIADPVFQLLWDHAVATTPENFFVSIKIRFVRKSGLATLSTTIRINRFGKAEAEFDWLSGKELESPIASFCHVAGLERFSMISAFDGEMHAQRVYADIPHRALLEGIRSALADDAFKNHPLKISAFVGHSIIEKGGISLYDQYRPLLNNMSSQWHTQLDACYRDNFDVFRRPEEIPADCGEIRYPVIAIPNKEHDGPKLQIDVVHRPSVSSLEFHSTDGEAVLNKAAKAAGVKLKMWEGPLHLRWRE